MPATGWSGLAQYRSFNLCRPIVKPPTMPPLHAAFRGYGPLMRCHLCHHSSGSIVPRRGSWRVPSSVVSTGPVATPRLTAHLVAALPRLDNRLCWCIIASVVDPLAGVSTPAGEGCADRPKRPSRRGLGGVWRGHRPLSSCRVDGRGGAEYVSFGCVPAVQRCSPCLLQAFGFSSCLG